MKDPLEGVGEMCCLCSKKCAPGKHIHGCSREDCPVANYYKDDKRLERERFGLSGVPIDEPRHSR